MKKEYTIDDIRKALKELDKPTSLVTKHENIGGIVFPVTYLDNGMVLIDYPDRPFDFFKI